jgi:hypothetical protein
VARARERDFRKAASAFDRALIFAPDDPEIYLNPVRSANLKENSRALALVAHGNNSSGR